MTTTKAKEVDSTIDNSRRHAMGVFGAIGALGVTGLIGYNSSATTANSGLSSVAATLDTASAGSNVLVPSHTLGTFPLATILNNSSFLREAISEDKVGVPLMVKLKLVNVNDNYAPISGYVYIWHCDNNGLYSGHEDNVAQASQTYCRGLQSTDSDGQATFTTIYPGQDEERMPHINFQIFLTTPSGTTNLSAVSQMTFPKEITTAVYDSNLYGQSLQNSIANFSTNRAFSDGVAYQMATVTGNIVDGFVAELEVGIAVS